MVSTTAIATNRSTEMPILMRLAALALVAFGLNWVLSGATLPDEVARKAPSLALDMAGNGAPWLFLLAVIWLLALYLRDRLADGWMALDHGRNWQIAAAIPLLFLTWEIALEPVDFLNGPGRVADRMLLVLGALLTIWRPVFLPAFLALAWSMTHAITLEPEAMEDRYFLLRLLTVIAAYVPLARLVGARDALLLALALFAAWLLAPGLAKLQMGYHDWLLGGEAQPIRVLAAAVASGWFDFLTEAQQTTLIDTLRPLALPAAWALFGLQLVALIFLAQRWLTLTVLALALIVQVAMFWMFGTLHWGLITGTVVLCWLIGWAPGTSQTRYSMGEALLSLPLIGAMAFWLFPAAPAPFDNDVSGHVALMGVTESGDAVPLPWDMLAPYGDQILRAPDGLILTLPNARGLATTPGVGEDLSSAAPDSDTVLDTLFARRLTASRRGWWSVAAMPAIGERFAQPRPDLPLTGFTITRSRATFDGSTITRQDVGSLSFTAGN